MLQRALLFLLVVVTRPENAVAQSPAAGDHASHRVAVPFISSAQAQVMEYENKDVLNPSFGAAVAMVLKYGGQDLKLLKDFKKALPTRGGWAIVEQEHAADFTKLKGFIDRDIPVIVTPTMTPFAHPDDEILGFIAMAKKVGLAPLIGTSGVFPRMRSVTEYMTLKQKLGDNFHWESVLIQARVVVGYDDTRQVVIMHDPLIGPGVEVPYADFELMWAPTDRWYTSVEPRNRARIRADSASLRRPTPAEMAVQKFIWGYSLEAVGRFDEAAEMLRSALNIEALPFELRYLVLNELGYVLGHQGKLNEALAYADRASEIGPESPSPWRLRLVIFQNTNSADASTRAAEAEATLNRLCADKKALDALRDSFRTYLPVWSFGCGN